MNRNNLVKIRPAREVDIESVLCFERRNRAWFALFLPSQALYTQDDKTHFSYLLKRKTRSLQYLLYQPPDVVVGRFSGQILDVKNRTLEVSYRVDQHYLNQGIARQALKYLLLVWASYGIKEVYAQVADHNKASIKVLLACGFELFEIQRNAIKLPSGIHDGWGFRWSVDSPLKPDNAPVC
ncbi:GNAT family N-acetyltransferase [Marinomonas sp. M1K-6]|uniref:GNAT family N-acetyltransferase n=1 Tax=Marinomonas profundi TaxID=2726122 RepID=A0A847QZL4_9GAMM|nr:GNAT family protein [Marinomonas profundi]NLQ16375.1 GNAT family N-acetyltransferase [Marinomonas profundi]UDV03051.1 GNAT family N-acetyltransferase [Marinomonas profundi]